MNRINKIQSIRDTLKKGGPSIGSWIQLPCASVAEIMGQSGYEWVAVDMEHGSITASQLPDLFRALELGNTLPLARLIEGNQKECKQALDAGAGGVIVPMVETSEQLEKIRLACSWPPSGTRGVGFSRANLFGKHFGSYSLEAQKPLLIAMIEHVRAVANLNEILAVQGLDAILVGPYDLSASMGITDQFDRPEFIEIMSKIKLLCKSANIASGIHVVAPSPIQLLDRVNEGYQFIAYSLDSVFLEKSAICPDLKG